MIGKETPQANPPSKPKELGDWVVPPSQLLFKAYFIGHLYMMGIELFISKYTSINYKL
jgi:hypothetical protein